MNRLWHCTRLVALLGVLACRPALLAQEAVSQETLPTPTPPPAMVAPVLPPAAAPMPPPATVAPSPPPASQETGNVPAGRLRIRAQRQVFSPDAGLYRFYGDVSVTKSDLELDAQEMTYQAGDDTLLASGDVSLKERGGQTYRGKALEYHPRTGKWQFREWSTAFNPAALGRPFVAPIYASGDVAAGSSRLDLTKAQLTTCDKANPDYDIVARTVDIYPGDKLIARDVDLYVLGKRIMHLPWLFFFLRDDRPTEMPTFGRNEFEGYFLRTPFQYVLGPDQVGTFRLDLTEKRGIGLGVDHFYTLGSGSGEAFAYDNPSSGDFALRLNHDQQLLPSLALDINLDRKRQSVLSGTPVETSNTMIQLRNTTDHATTLAQYTQNNTNSTFNLQSTSLSLRQTFQAGDNKFNYDGEYRRNSYGAAVAENENLWNHLLYTRSLGFGNLNVRMDQYTDMASNTSNFGLNQLERLPEVMLQVDQKKLGWSVPGRLLVGWGEYREQTGKDPLGRFLLDWQATPKLSLTKSTALQFTTGLRQTAYGDQDISAQYQYQFNVSALTKVGSLTHVLSYGLQHGSGFSPLFMDSVYPNSTVTDSLQYLTPSLKLSLTAGRDLQWNRWHDVALTAEEHAGTHLILRQNVSYDPNMARWRDLTNQLDWQQDPRLALSLYTRYNLDQHLLRSATAQLQWHVTPQWQLWWRGNYDGTQFLWNEWLIVRDLHCWEVGLRFDTVNGDVGLTLRPKAIESSLIPEIGFGLNNRWSLGTGVAF